MSSVLQPWVAKMPWKCQSILLSGLRGPDTHHAPKTKEVTRWLRRETQNDADPSQSYMAPVCHPEPHELEKELEYGSVHFLHHFCDALRCVAIFHPDEDSRQYARDVHDYLAEELLHWKPETDDVFKWRHRDRVEHA